MGYHNDGRLDALADGDETRTLLLKDRQGRKRSKSTHKKCPACGEEGWSNVAPGDICDDCLVDLWGAQSLLKSKFDAAQKKGMIPVKVPVRNYTIAYPHFSTNYDRVPKTAQFYRAERGGGHSDMTSETVLRTLYGEIGHSLSKLAPINPADRENSEPLITCDGGFQFTDFYFANIPKELAKALRDLWAFSLWHSQIAYQQGYDDGSNLLFRLNDGGVTHQAFADAIEEQTKEMLEKTAKHARGMVITKDRIRN